MVLSIAMYHKHFNLTSVISLHTVEWLNSSIWFIYETQTGTIIQGQSGLGSNGNEEVLHIPQSSRTRASPSDDLVSYPDHLLGSGSYPSAVMQSE